MKREMGNGKVNTYECENLLFTNVMGGSSRSRGKKKKI